jgi:DNA-binding CsgD family transcriptional regulator
MSQPLRVALVGSRRLLLEALAVALQGRDVDAVWSAPDAVADVTADVWVFETADRVGEVAPGGRVLFIDLDDDAGAAGGSFGHPVLRASCDLTHLVAVLRGEAAPAPPRPAPGAPVVARLSPREVEVLTRLAAGDSQPEIAAALAVSEQTVRTHIQNAMAKVGAHLRREALLLAQQAGQIPIPPREDLR